MIKSIKKLNIFINIIFSIILFSNIFFINTKAEENINLESSNMLGRAIKFSNSKKHKFETVGMEIFNEEFKKNLLKNLIKRKYNYTYFEEKSFEKLSNYNEKLKIAFENTKDFGLKYRDLEVNSSLMISSKYSDLYSKSNSSFFSILNTKIYQEFIEIKDHLNYDKFRNNLSRFFTKKLENILKYENENMYFEFFKKYGSHILVSGYFGGSLNVVNSFFSKNVDIKKLYGTKIANKQKIALNNLKIEKSFNFELEKTFENNYSNISHHMLYERQGGLDYFGTSFDSIARNFRNWKNSISNNKELIEIPEYGTIPYWLILPSNINTYKNRKKLEEKYKLYLLKEKTSIKSSLLDEYDPEKGLIEIEFLNIDKKRPEYMKNKYITDAYYGDNIVFDKVDFSEKINIDFLKLYGYNKVHVEITHDVDEIDDGWQYVSIFNYKNADKNYYNMIVENYGYSLPEEKDWGTQSYPVGTFELDKLENILIFYIRYRGSGRGSDDWINRNVNIKIIFDRG